MLRMFADTLRTLAVCDMVSVTGLKYREQGTMRREGVWSEKLAVS